MTEDLIQIPDEEGAIRACSLFVNQDGTQAFFKIGGIVDEKLLHAMLQRGGVRYGVLSPVVATIAIDSLASELDKPLALVAQGDPPQDGQDGYVEYVLPIDRKEQATDSSAGKVDYRTRTNVINVNTGKVIAKMIPPTMGEAGTSIFSKTLPARKGVPCKIRPGKNVELNPAGEFVSKIDGHAFLDGERIDVTPTFTVTGDIDFSVGNIDFVGEVLVTGNILPDFIVKAGTNIIVNGTVDGAILEAGGDIQVSRGIVGRNKCKIKCGGSLSSHFLSECEVECPGNITVVKEIRLSKIRCAGKVVVERGAILGGEITACQGIEASVLGSPLGVPTTVRVGIDYRIEGEAKAIEDKSNRVRDKIVEINNVVTPLRKDAKVLATMTQRRRRAIDRLVKIVEMLQLKKGEAEGLIEEIKRRAVVKGQSIICRQSLNEDVEIAIGLNVERRFRNLSSGRFVYVDSSDQIECKPIEG